jgi:hypothetical protein
VLYLIVESRWTEEAVVDTAADTMVVVVVEVVDATAEEAAEEGAVVEGFAISPTTIVLEVEVVVVVAGTDLEDKIAIKILKRSCCAKCPPLSVAWASLKTFENNRPILLKYAP